MFVWLPEAVFPNNPVVGWAGPGLFVDAPNKPPAAEGWFWFDVVENKPPVESDLN